MDDILMDNLYTNKPKTTLVNSNENLVDGDIDSLTIDIFQSNEDLNFIDAFESVSKKNAEDKIRMMKKIKTNYKLSNENLNYSIESFCDSEIQSLEEESSGKVKGYGLSDKIKDKFVSIFRKIAEFVKHLMDMFTARNFKGKTADKIKNTLKIVYDGNKKYEKALLSPTSNLQIDDNIKRVIKIYTNNRKFLLNVLKIYSLINKINKKTTNNKSISIDTDMLENAISEKRPLFNNMDKLITSTNKISTYLAQKASSFSSADNSYNKDLTADLDRNIKLSEDAIGASDTVLNKLMKDYENMNNTSKKK